MRELTLTALPGIPEVTTGAPLAELLLAALGRAGKVLEPGDVLVLAQKIVSKAEGRSVRLAGCRAIGARAGACAHRRKGPAAWSS